MTKENEENAQKMQMLLDQNNALREQIAILLNARFGRKTEKTKEIMNGQMSFLVDEDMQLVINESEQIEETSAPEKERTEEELRQMWEKRKRKKGVRKDDLKMAQVIPEHFTIPEEGLQERFPEGYTQMDEEISLRVEYTPASLVVHEEHIHKYRSKTRSDFVTAPHPSHLLPHSIATESLIAKIFTDKFVNAIPVNRISREFG